MTTLRWPRQAYLDPNLRKMGYNPRTKYYHRIKFNGGFYAANCETGTRITHFEEVEELRGRREPCKKCFPKGEPVPVSWEWDGPWFLANMRESQPIEGQWYVCRRKLGATSAQFGPFTEGTARELMDYLLRPEEE